MPYGLAHLLNQQAHIGFYVHVPFCPHICPYCDFVKTSRFTKSDVDQYFSNLKAQTEFFIEQVQTKHTHCTVYFGGGTPGLFDTKMFAPIIETIAKRFTIEECTIETNPFTNSERKLSDYKQVGFDRITLGAQSLCEKTLKILGRKHTAEDVFKNIEAAQKAGIQQIQVDLIYGLKAGTRTQRLSSEIEQLAKHGASGISAYALTIEKRTLFANSDWANDDVAADEYEELYTSCAAAGFKQIETSNFSKFEAKHNNLYWYGLPYFGIGTGAHGLMPATADAPFGRRYRVGANLTEIEPGNDNLQQLSAAQQFELHFDEPRTKRQYADELIFTALRTPHGLPIVTLSELFGDDVKAKLRHDQRIQRALAENRLNIDEKSLALNWQEKIRGDSWALHLSWLLQQP